MNALQSTITITVTVNGVHSTLDAVTGDLTAEPPPTSEEIRERMRGNLCRCGAYVNIVQAITATAAAGVEG